MEKSQPIDPLLELLKDPCKAKDINFGALKKRLQYLVGSDTVIDYYISEGPFPTREEVLLDVFILSPLSLYNIEVRTIRKAQLIILCHRLFLDHISLIEEKPEYSEDGELFIACVIFTAMHDLILRVPESKHDDAEKFFTKIRDAVVALKQGKG